MAFSMADVQKTVAVREWLISGLRTPPLVLRVFERSGTLESALKHYVVVTSVQWGQEIAKLTPPDFCGLAPLEQWRLEFREWASEHDHSVAFDTDQAFLDTLEIVFAQHTSKRLRIDVRQGRVWAALPCRAAVHLIFGLHDVQDDAPEAVFNASSRNPFGDEEDEEEEEEEEDVDFERPATDSDSREEEDEEEDEDEIDSDAADARRCWDQVDEEEREFALRLDVAHAKKQEVSSGSDGETYLACAAQQSDDSDSALSADGRAMEDNTTRG